MLAHEQDTCVAYTQNFVNKNNLRAALAEMDVYDPEFSARLRAHAWSKRLRQRTGSESDSDLG